MVKILFLQDILYEHIGIMYLSRQLKSNGHKCEVLVESEEEDFIKKIITKKPDIIAFSAMTGMHKWCLKLSNYLRKHLNSLIIMGGPHPTFFPSVIENDSIDMICRGEGEEAIVELSNNLRDKRSLLKIKNLWIKDKEGRIHKNDVRNLVKNLDNYQFPDREIYYHRYPYLRKKSVKPFFIARGCPYDCTFCFNHAFKEIYSCKGPFLRNRSIDNVLNEIKNVKRKYGLKKVYFQDDTFILFKNWMKEFLVRYKKEINLPFICLARADQLDEELVKLMKEANCICVFFGIETGNEKLREEVLKKRVTNKQIINSGKLLKKYKIRFKTYNMLGLPGESLENAIETVNINIKIKTDYPWCSILQPYPGTKIADYMISKKMINKNFNVDDMEEFFFDKSMIKTQEAKEIDNLQKLFFYSVKFPILKPLIKKLIKLPPNIAFEVLFWIGYAYVYIGSERLNPIKTLFFGAKNLLKIYKRKLSG